MSSCNHSSLRPSSIELKTHSDNCATRLSDRSAVLIDLCSSFMAMICINHARIFWRFAWNHCNAWQTGAKSSKSRTKITRRKIPENKSLVTSKSNDSEARNKVAVYVVENLKARSCSCLQLCFHRHVCLLSCKIQVVRPASSLIIYRISISRKLSVA